MVKLDLSKAYDLVSWLYLRLLLIHIGFSLTIIKWIMAYVTITSFVFLINGFAYEFFDPSKGLNMVRTLLPSLPLCLLIGCPTFK